MNLTDTNLAINHIDITDVKNIE